jgi:hypothetical protein
LIKTYQILGVTCDNASANDTMVESLAMVMSHFSGEANRARCLAHIVNLVAKIILRQFDMPRKKKTADVPDDIPEDIGDTVTSDEETDKYDDEMKRVLDKEEKEMDEGEEDDDDQNPTTLARDIEIIEKAMEDEIERVGKDVKPVRHVLYKVILCLLHFYSSRSPPTYRC